MSLFPIISYCCTLILECEGFLIKHKNNVVQISNNIRDIVYFRLSDVILLRFKRRLQFKSDFAMTRDVHILIHWLL